jgi:glycosyltransferase involved in cell wall biosynthesis
VSTADSFPLTGRHVALLSWRDTQNPEGGGAERFLEKMAQGLTARGCRVTIFCAAHAGVPPEEQIDGVRYVRRGSKLTVYLWGMLLLLTGRLGKVDVVVDVQNGLPFFTRLVTRGPVIVLVHHVHREQWPVVYPGLTGRVGWWIERSLAPRLYRNCQYVAVSRATRSELADLGVEPGHVAVVHNGTDQLVRVEATKSSYPSICSVGRLVPHKQVEHAIDATLRLRQELPGLRLTIVGSGWWEPRLKGYADQQGAGDSVEFTGHVDEIRKQEIYERSWVMALPSIKEGWGLVVGEAAMHGTPTVAYRSAGGTRESIDDHVSGLLVDTAEELVDAIRTILVDPLVRAGLAEGARAHSGRFTWDHSQAAFAHVVSSAIRGEWVSSQDEVTAEDQLPEP